jgi:ABC-type branched-subunit amino acid transport system substrate-binding protein
VVEDDRSRPARAARLYAELVERGCQFVLGPYGSDSARAVAAARTGAVVWNHGAAADDVQRLPGVVSVPSPASRYLVALGRAVAALRPAATVALVTATGRFARFAREGLERAGPALGLGILACFSFRDPPAAAAAAGADAILACGPVGAEVVLFRALARLAPSTLRGGVSPGLAAFPALLGGDPEGLLAPVQWHPETRTSPELGPSSAELIADARASALGELDYVAAQAYAAALIAGRCLELGPDDPLGAARRLRTTTFFGAFELDPATGLQRGHRLSVLRWGRARQESPASRSQLSEARARYRHRPPALAQSRKCVTLQKPSAIRCSPRWRTKRTYPSPSCETQCEQRKGHDSLPAGSVTPPPPQREPLIAHGTTCSIRQKTARRPPAGS